MRSHRLDGTRRAAAPWPRPTSLPPLILLLLTPAWAQQPTRPASAPLDFATALLNERRYELAAEEFERFLQTRPAPDLRADALYGLARARLFLREYPRARAAFEQFLDTAPEHPNADSARFRLAEAILLAGDPASAEPLLSQFVSRAPDHVHAQAAWNYLGDVRAARADSAGARDAYEKALAIRPEGPLADRARFQLARVLADLGEIDRALALFDELSRRPDSTQADRARLQAGVVQLKAGRFDDALRTFTALEAAHPGDPPAEPRIRRAEALAGLKRFDEAEALLEPLASGQNVTPAIAAQAAYSLGQIRLDAGRADAALAAWDAALQHPDTPLAPMLLFRSAEALATLGRDAEARARFLQLAERYPADPWADLALLRAARLAFDAKDYSAARALAASFPERFPSSPRRPDARLIEARAEQAVGNLEPAIRLYRALLDQDQPGPETRQTALYYLNQAYRDSGQEDRAAEVLAELAKTPAATLAANARFSLGQERFQAGRFADAIEPLQTYLDEQPRGDLAAPALALLALAHHELGRDAEARAALDRLTREWPDGDEAARVRVRLGEAALQAKHFDDAINLLRPAAERPAAPLTARARASLGWALYGATRFPEAAAAFASVPDADAEAELAAEAALMRGWSLQQAGQDADALLAFESVVRDHPATPPARAAALARARLLARTGKPAEAADAFAALAASPDPDADPAELLRDLAFARLDAGREDDAAASFRELLEKHPDSTQAAAARLELAEIAYRRRRLDDAAKVLEPLLADPPPPGAEPPLQARALFRAARVALERGDADRCVALLTRLIDGDLDPSLRDQARFWRAEAHLRADNPRSAEPEFAALAAGSSAPAEAEAWRDTARLRRLQCLLAMRRWADALAEASAFLADRPGTPLAAELHFARGRALQSQALPRFDEARAAYQAAIDARPGSEIAARAQFMRGETFLHEKNPREALREFHQVELLYQAPTWQAAALLELGKAYETLGQPDQALASYAKLLDAFPDDAHAPEARDRLAALRDR
jgi:TolA-binding protein